MESNADDIRANLAQNEAEIPSPSQTTGLEDAGGRCTTSPTPLEEMILLANVVLLILGVQVVAGTGLILLAHFGASDISAWLCKYSVAGFYFFFFTQTVGVQIYYRITQLATVEGTRRHLLKKCSLGMIQVLVFIAMVLQTTHVYCSVSKNMQFQLVALVEAPQQ
ncbi:hypothetical protein AYL99_02235 [Fonsecaea erecta]|uniref:Uncharacterized protein n=1 Tax=Fonsecaea erecta TaxID=1367422 RepID=A0A178ZT89_9EURO|nr:hypothetical protein AYL99_02235 [Fonsecaea erecta]OAP63008.1 hypothetical protein AYL99_02235 [Fonsecaea erecta]